MSTITSFIRPQRKNSRGKCKILLRFEVDGKQAVLSLDQSIHPSKWSRKKQRVLDSHPEAKNVNPVIDAAIAKAQNLKAQMQIAGQDLTAKAWRNAMRPDTVTGGFLAFIDGFIADLGSDQFQYRKRLTSTAKKLRMHVGPELPWRSFDTRVLESFSRSLRAEGLATNGRRQLLVTLKTLYNHAVRQGVCPSDLPNPFDTLSIPSEEPSKAWCLSAEEYILLRDAELTGGSWCAISRDVFVLAVNLSGGRIGDMISLRWDNVSEERFAYRMSKNGKHVEGLISPDAKEILERYRRDQSGSYIFPFDPEGALLTETDRSKRKSSLNALCNREIKKAALIAGIAPEKARRLTMHVARHTFTNFMVESGANINVIASSLKHSSVARTELYVHRVSDKALDDAVSKALDRNTAA